MYRVIKFVYKNTHYTEYNINAGLYIDRLMGTKELSQTCLTINYLCNYNIIPILWYLNKLLHFHDMHDVRKY